MKIFSSMILAISVTLPSLSIANEGEDLFQTHCAVCHGANVGGMDLQKRIAPPIAAVKMHYLESYPDQESFREAVANWVTHRDERASLMRGAIRKFNLMPPISIANENVLKIADFIYTDDIKGPEGFKEHVKKEHAGKGKGMGNKNHN